MKSKQQENLDLLTQLETREAGVADLYEFYARIEKVYTAASKAFEEPSMDATSDSTKPAVVAPAAITAVRADDGFVPEF
jgi:hypothetical protein